MHPRGEKTILVIDDEDFIRNSMVSFLEDRLFHVVEAENGRKGLAQFDAHHPDMVLCDLRMPEMDGLEVLAHLAEHHQKIPVIIVSGAGNISLTVEALRLGAWDYIIKPIQDMNVLYHAVNKAFERAQLIRQKEKYQKDLESAIEELKHSLLTLQNTQDKLVQSEKMAALGELVAGVAHEINTPVGVGVTAASFLEMKTQILRKRFESGELKKSDLEKFLSMVNEVSTSILINMERAAELISSFKQVAVDQSSQKRRQFNLKAYIGEILLSLGPKYNKTGHTISVQCDPDIELDSYPGAFSQILNNLILNSLTHGFEHMANGEIRIAVEPKDGGFNMIYTDNGKGMTEEEKQKAFDPFYTTHRGKGGTGLGMFIVYNLITQTLRGSITNESRESTGASFVMWFPQLPEDGS